MFEFENVKIWQKITVVFFVIILTPLLIFMADYFYLNIDEQLDNFSTQQIFLDIMGSCFGVFISIYFTTREFNMPLSLLMGSIKKVSRGDYQFQTPVISNDEFGILTAHFNIMIKGLAEREFIRNTFGKYVTPEVAKEILSNQDRLSSNRPGEEKIVTILFTDIENYTGLSETLDPSNVVMLLNEYFTDLVSIIQKHNGIVNKFIGDSIMAIFHVPEIASEHSKNAVLAALEINELCSNKIYLEKFKLKTRIGINTGKVVIGNIGSDDRKEYTVIGDEVNIAARLEQLNKNYSSTILVSQNTFELTESQFEFYKIGDVQLKGKQSLIGVYKL